MTGSLHVLGQGIGTPTRGSSGGGVMFAFSTAVGIDSPVFGVPFDSTSPEDVAIVASTFAAFVHAIGREWQEAV